MADFSKDGNHVAMGNVHQQPFYPRAGFGLSQGGPPLLFEGLLAQMAAFFGCSQFYAEERYDSRLCRYSRMSTLFLSRAPFANPQLFTPCSYRWTSFANQLAIAFTLLGNHVTSRGFGDKNEGHRARRRSPTPTFERAVMGGFDLKFMYANLWLFAFGDGCMRQNHATQMIYRGLFCAWAMPGMPPAPVAEEGEPRLRFTYTKYSQAVGQGHFDILVFQWLLAQRLGYRVSGLHLNQRADGRQSVSFILENAGECCDEGNK